MKKKMISLKSLQETLNANELKNILGGSGAGPGGSDGICMATTTFDGTNSTVLCTNDAQRAIAYADKDGWWCCNCDDAIEYCGPLMEW